MAEPPTTTSSTPCSAQSALHSEAIFKLLMVGSRSAVMSARADLIFWVSMISEPHRNIFPRQKPFHIADGVGAKMENARGEDGIRLAFEQYFGHVFQTACSPARHHRHAHRFADA